MVIYIDVLLGINIYINYLLLLLTAYIARCSPPRTRVCLGALFGALGACVMLLDISVFAGVMLKVLCAAAMVLIVFGFGSARSCFFRSLILICVTFALAGMTLGIKSVFASDFISVKNFSVYFDVSPVFLIAVTAICYAVMTVISKLAKKRAPEAYRCTVCIEAGGKSVKLGGIIDTGNSLTEPFSGQPVIIAAQNAVEKVCPRGLFSKDITSGIRLIPFTSVGGDGLMRSFKPDRVTVTFNGKKCVTSKVWIAVSQRGDDKSQAIVNSEITDME